MSGLGSVGARAVRLRLLLLDAAGKFGEVDDAPLVIAAGDGFGFVGRFKLKRDHGPFDMHDPGAADDFFPDRRRSQMIDGDMGADGDLSLFESRPGRFKRRMFQEPDQ